MDRLLQQHPLPEVRKRTHEAVASWPEAALPGDPESLGRLVRAAARLNPLAGSCLRRALVLEALLLRQGRKAELCIGARRGKDGELHAHAWVTLDGFPLGEPNGIELSFPPLKTAGSGEGLPRELS